MKCVYPPMTSQAISQTHPPLSLLVDESKSVLHSIESCYVLFSRLLCVCCFLWLFLTFSSSCFRYIIVSRSVSSLGSVHRTNDDIDQLLLLDSTGESAFEVEEVIVVSGDVESTWMVTSEGFDWVWGIFNVSARACLSISRLVDGRTSGLFY